MTGVWMNPPPNSLGGPADCPRCGATPVEAVVIGGPSRWLPRCSCYPHPPRCVCCHQALDGDRCGNERCYVAWVLQPAPDIDPLYEPLRHARLP